MMNVRHIMLASALKSLSSPISAGGVHNAYNATPTVPAPSPAVDVTA